MCEQNCVSDNVVRNNGAPQGTALSPFHFSLYTTDFCYRSKSCHLQRFSDDSVIVGCFSEGDESEYRTVIIDFVTWSELNHMQLKVGVKVNTVDHYNYPGLHIDNKLDWAWNTKALYIFI